MERLRAQSACPAPEAAIPAQHPFLDVLLGNVRRWLDAGRDVARPDGQIVDALPVPLCHRPSGGAGRLAALALTHPADAPLEPCCAAGRPSPLPMAAPGIQAEDPSAE